MATTSSNAELLANLLDHEINVGHTKLQTEVKYFNPADVMSITKLQTILSPVLMLY